MVKNNLTILFNQSVGSMPFNKGKGKEKNCKLCACCRFASSLLRPIDAECFVTYVRLYYVAHKNFGSYLKHFRSHFGFSVAKKKNAFFMLMSNPNRFELQSLSGNGSKGEVLPRPFGPLLLNMCFEIFGAFNWSAAHSHFVGVAQCWVIFLLSISNWSSETFIFASIVWAWPADEALKLHCVPVGSLGNISKFTFR